jgi:hypothetical protein
MIARTTTEYEDTAVRLITTGLTTGIFCVTSYYHSLRLLYAEPWNFVMHPMDPLHNHSRERSCDCDAAEFENTEINMLQDHVISSNYISLSRGLPPAEILL